MTHPVQPLQPDAPLLCRPLRRNFGNAVRQEWLGDGDGHHHLNSSAGRPLWLKRPARWKTEGKTIVSAASVLTALPVKVAIT